MMMLQTQDQNPAQSPQDTPTALRQPLEQGLVQQQPIDETGGGSRANIDFEPSGFPEWDQSAGFFSNIWAFVDHLWDMKLFTVGESEVFVNQLVIALFAFLTGLILSKIIARRVGKKVLPRMKVEPGPASAIQTILYYLLLLITAIIALQIAQVPLTVFTIFGGALALGIGFGSQNIMNNFISGLILMLERPVQVNDIVTVNGETGVIRKIGARATHIQRYDGVTNIVPNSHLLENAVANYALPDPRMRCIISVGVAYGSDTALVKETLESLLGDHERVIDSPENRVLFMGFGDSSLDFEVHFWITLRSTLDRRQIESDLRFKIDALFRENNITIPFPQRDVHFFNESGHRLPVELNKDTPQQTQG